MGNGLPYTERQTSLIAVTSFCIIVSTLAVALRLLARRQFHIKLWWDDYIAVIALIFSYFPNVLTIMGVKAGLGRHFTDVSHEQAKYIGVTVWLHQLTWYISFTAIIITILILYVRIFPNPWLQTTSRWMGYFTVVWMMLNVLVVVFQCTPVQYFWDRGRAGGGHCIHANEYYAIACGISMGMIIVVFLLPLPIIRKLQISRSKKWGLGLAFTVGAFACVSSVMRLVLVFDIDPKDQMWTISPAILWGCLEISIGVVSACIPSLMPLFLIMIGKKKVRKESGSPGYVKYGQGNDKPSTARTNRFNRINRLWSVRDLEMLPEAIELTTSNQTCSTDDDDVRLFDGTKKPGEIVVTNQIHLSNSTPTSQEANTGTPTSWIAYPTTTHPR